MKAKIISFDEVLDSIKSGNIKNIYLVDIWEKWVRKLSDLGIVYLVEEREDNIFIKAELDGE
ncbi:MAG: hypothetical protein KHX91_01850 [Clostridium sp.]|nr:hypothetical protein [Clostridium sp.]